MLSSEKGRAHVSLLIWAGWDNAFSRLEGHAPGNFEKLRPLRVNQRALLISL